MRAAARVDFDKILRSWDGFGVNYVETSQTRDYASSPQDYGGFGSLSEPKRREVVERVFGDDGLCPGVVKVFLDPFHQREQPYGSELIDQSQYDHESTTRWQRYFLTEGLERTRARGDGLQVLVGMYGPPAWMTKQKQVRGRDLADRHRDAYAKYLVAYAHYLRTELGAPVTYVSIHNEGESWSRWPDDGTDPRGATHDYNVYFSPEAVADMIPRVRRVLDANGMHDVGVTSGETYSWPRFHQWGYADAIADHPTARKAIGLVTSHGFAFGGRGRWYGDWRNKGLDIVCNGNGLKSWVTSCSWCAMDANFVWELYQHIYCADVSAIIPWACIQHPASWGGQDPNPGRAFTVDGNGTVRTERGYWYYKQATRAGRPGTGVARTRCNDADVAIMAFARNNTRHDDSFVVMNRSEKNETKELAIDLRGTAARSFEVFRSSPDERYEYIDTVSVDKGELLYTAPADTVTTFVGCGVRGLE